MLVSVAPDNPSPEAMARLWDAADDPAMVLTTGQHGDITLVSDGRSVRVQTRPCVRVGLADPGFCHHVLRTALFHSLRIG